MSRNKREKVERNRELLEAHKTGESFHSIAVRYGITAARVRRIVQRERGRERREELIQKVNGGNGGKKG